MVSEYEARRGNDMSEFVAEFFTATTAEDEANYFYGDDQEHMPSRSEVGAFAPGAYRVIDGMLCRIVSGLPVEDIRDQLCAANKNVQ